MKDNGGAAAGSSLSPTAPVDDEPGSIGPLFISGRQHSGNTVVTMIFGQVPECFPSNVEGWFFEHRGLVEKIRDPAKRANYVVDILRLEDAALAERARQWLVRWHLEHPRAASIDVYRQAMQFVTAGSGKRFWVQKATSYIFYGEQILSLMPDARMLYLLRNPYDVCASKKRRNPREDRFLGWVVSWNMGLRLATRLQQHYPDRFRLVRYEDMVTTPVETMRGIFDFAGVPFQERYLDVPHVNRSEAHQARTSETRGLNPSRVYYYTGILSPAEIAAVDMLASKRMLAEQYPDLPHRRGAHAPGTRLKALGWLAVSPLLYAGQQAQRLVRQKSAWRFRRLLWRVRLLFR